MQIKMGNYYGKRNVANKPYKVNYEGGLQTSMATRGAIDPRNFYLDLAPHYYVNYGSFTYAGKTYWCYITVTTTTKGLFRYIFDVDPLTTAYANGCFDAVNMVQYANIVQQDSLGNPSNNNYMVDNRIPVDPIYKHQYLSLESPERIYKICVVVNYPAAIVTSSESSITPGYLVYFMNPSVYSIFVASLANEFSSKDASKANAFQQSIVKTYAIPASWIPDSLGTTDTVTLSAIVSNAFGLDTQARYYDIPLQVSSESPMHTCQYINPAYSNTIYKDVVASFSKTLNAVSMRGVINVHAQYAGNISFSPATYGITSFTRIGYRQFFDFVGAQSYFTPIKNSGSTANNTLIDENLRCYSMFNEILPGITEIANNGWMNIASSALRFAASGGLNPVNSVATGLQAVGQIGSTVSDVMRNSGNSAASGGPVGGDLDRASHRGSFMYFDYQDYFDYANFKSEFGVPVFRKMNLNSSSFNNVDKNGYCKTTNCQLTARGLPEWCIQGAEAILNNGAYIGSTNMPTS